MKKDPRNTIILFCSCLLILQGCGSGDKIVPSTPSQTTCQLQSESTSLVGNETTWNFSYDADGNPFVIKRTNASGKLTDSVNSAGLNVDILYGSGYRRYAYDKSILGSSLPATCTVSYANKDDSNADYMDYVFSYDSKKRLIKIEQYTYLIKGDNEYVLNVFYNDQDNVTKLVYDSYQWSSGGGVTSIPITVTAYDDKPTPYHSFKNWKFLMHNYNWDNYDPEPILTILSANNPLDYTTGSGDFLFTRTMSYTYNEKGFPTERKNTNKNINGEYTFVQSFSYTCP